MDNSSPRREGLAGGRDELLRIGVERKNSHARVVPVGEVDLATAPDLDVALRGITSEDGVHRVVVDLSGVTFIDSSGIHVLCRAANGARRDGFNFGVTRPPNHIRRLFVLAGIDQVVDIVEP